MNPSTSKLSYALDLFFFQILYFSYNDVEYNSRSNDLNNLVGTYYTVYLWRDKR